MLYAAMYEKHRTPWQLVLSGPGTGLYRTDDGGAKWQKLDGGLPTGKLGRIGLDIYQKNPNILYALVENLNPRRRRWARRSTRAQRRRRGAGGRRERAAAGDGRRQPQGRGARRRDAHRQRALPHATTAARRGARRTATTSTSPAARRRTRSTSSRSTRTIPITSIVTSDTMYSTRDGGKTWGCTNTNGFFRGVFGDFRTIWWDPEDPNRIMLGSDGGVNVSYDGGRTGDYFLNMALGEVYAIGVDMDDPYNVYGGLQDHDSWKGPTNGPTGRITLEHWTTVGPGDGMYNQVDPTDTRWVYNTREMGNHGRFDQTTGERTVIAPPAPPGSRRCATTGSRRSCCRRTTRRSSTPARSSCSARSTAATPGK